MDVDALVEHWVALADEQAENGTLVRGDANRDVVREEIAHGVVTDSVLVAVDDEEGVVGFAHVTVSNDGYERTATRGTVRTLYVEPDRRDEGIGSDVLAAAEEVLAERDADVVTLETMATNDAARRFYRRHDYTPHRVQLAKHL